MSRRTGLLFGALAAALALYMLFLAYNEKNAFVLPDTGRQDITGALAAYPDVDYAFLFEQTGLGRRAVDEVMAAEGAEGILRFQEQYFARRSYRCEYLFPLTKEESLDDGLGHDIFTQLAPLHDGDILISLSTHTLGWRHGHCAIVTNAEAGETVEAVTIFSRTSVQHVEKWTNFPTIAVLRPRGMTDAQLSEVAAYTRDNLLDLPYRLLAGVLGKDWGTHCSYLVWSAFEHFGLDIDSNGGLVVTPEDILGCAELETVQVVGLPAAGLSP